MRDIGETSYDHVSGDDYCTSTADECWSKNMFNKLKEKYPNDIKITATNEDGSMVVQFPYSWLPRIKPKRKRILTENEKKVIADRLASGKAKNHLSTK